VALCAPVGLNTKIWRDWLAHEGAIIFHDPSISRGLVGLKRSGPQRGSWIGTMPPLPPQTLEHAPDDIALSGPKGVAYRAPLCSLTEPSRDLAIG
jgi:hypothetical protein